MCVQDEPSGCCLNSCGLAVPALAAVSSQLALRLRPRRRRPAKSAAPLSARGWQAWHVPAAAAGFAAMALRRRAVFLRRRRLLLEHRRSVRAQRPLLRERRGTGAHSRSGRVHTSGSVRRCGSRGHVEAVHDDILGAHDGARHDGAVERDVTHLRTARQAAFRRVVAAGSTCGTAQVNVGFFSYCGGTGPPLSLKQVP
eukprot:296770-Chlamydomonas_euryale.AAC.1